jgi:hypothetical protein
VERAEEVEAVQVEGALDRLAVTDRARDRAAVESQASTSVRAGTRSHQPYGARKPSPTAVATTKTAQKGAATSSTHRL